MQFFIFFHAIFFFVKASLFLHHTITSQTNTCHTCIFTGDHVVVGEKMLEYTFLMGNSMHKKKTQKKNCMKKIKIACINQLLFFRYTNLFLFFQK
jgi:hypothetical protein